MIYLNYLVYGLLIGFLMSAPIGPIAILCINTTLNRGIKLGLTVGLGTSVANIVFLGVLVLGLSQISDFYHVHVNGLKIIGSFFLFYLGVKIFFSKAENGQPISHRANYLSIFLISFFYTLISPLSIVLFSIVYILIMPSVHEVNYILLVILALSIFIGSMIWWFILVGLVNRLKHRFNLATHEKINKITGFVLFLFAILVLFKHV